MLIVRIVVFLASVSALISCGVISDRSDDYMEAEDGASLKVPDWYSSRSISPQYPIPSNVQRKLAGKSFEVPEPPDATAALNNEPFILEQVEDLTWLHLYTSPGKVWPLLDFFWNEYGIEIQYEEISNGYLLTKPLIDKAENLALVVALEGSEYSPSVADGVSFQARLTQGVRRNTTELHVRAVVPGTSFVQLVPSVAAAADPLAIGESRFRWQEQSVNPQLEKALLKMIGEFVTSDEQANRYSLLANDIGSESRVRMLEDQIGTKYLELDLSFQRAWSEIGQALDSAGVLIADKDRSEQVFYISYLNGEDVETWFGFGSADEKKLERNLLIKLRTDEYGKVIVRTELINQDLDPQEAAELLSLVFEHIS